MLTIDKSEKESIYIQIYKHFKTEIVTGKLVEGSRLPSTRSLSKTMEISRNTVEAAYLQLCTEGYVFGKAGSGYVVSKVEVDLYNETSVTSKELIEKALNEPHDQGINTTIKYNFQYGKLNIKDFPIRTWKSILNHVLNSDDIGCFSSYNDRIGEPQLRIEIMKYLYFSRGVSCKPEQIILCSGTLHSLSILCELLMSECSEIAVEEPCYYSARQVFKNHGLKILPIGVEEDGINLDTLKAANSKLVYTTPSHQYPTGKIMTINKRLNLIEWAAQNDAYIIEDDYDSEFRYNSRPIPSMQSLDNKERVIYINTFSKAFAPSLRMSYVVLPLRLLEKYKSNFSRYNCPVSWTDQKAMQLFMQDGSWSRHLRKICMINKKKHDTLIFSINQLMKDKVLIHGNNAGLHILLEVKNGMEEKELISSAESVGVRVYPVSVFWERPINYTNNMVLIGFSSLSEVEITDGIKLLHSAWF